jgi:hypothetical protein
LRPTPPVRSSSPDLGIYHLAPPTEGYKLEAWKSWCALREVRATNSFNITKSDHDDWRRHRDDYISRKLAKETEDRLSIAMADDAQLYLKGFSELPHEARIITALGFFTKGDTTTWAHVKKEEALADKL